MSKSARERARDKIAGFHWILGDPDREMLRDLLAEADALADEVRIFTTFECDPGCDSYGHTETCMAVTPFSSLQVQLFAARAEAERLKARLTQFTGEEPEDEAALATTMENIVAQACDPRLTPKDRAGLLLAAWRTYWGTGGPGLFARLEAASDLERVIDAALTALRTRLERADKLADAAEVSGEGCITDEQEPVEGHCHYCTLQARVRAYRSGA